MGILRAFLIVQIIDKSKNGVNSSPINNPKCPELFPVIHEALPSIAI
jgi:hypothetical protein